MNIILATLMVLSTLSLAVCHAVDASVFNVQDESVMKASYSDLFKISFASEKYYIRPFVPDDFTSDTIKRVFPCDAKNNIPIRKESLVAVFRNLSQPCFGVFEKKKNKCVGTTRLSIGRYFDNSFESSIRLVEDAKADTNEVRMALHEYLKTAVSRNKNWTLQYLEVLFENAADAAGAEATGLILYDSTKSDALALKDGISVQAKNILYYYPLQDSSIEATHLWWSCFSCCG